MTSWFRRFASVAAVCVLGCRDGTNAPTAPRTEVGPHQAVLYRLPDNLGRAELTNEPEVTERQGKPTTAIVVYFFQEDGKTPLSPAPTDVQVTVDQGRRRVETLSLKSDPKGDDPSGGCRFVSKVGPYLLEGLRGTFSAKVNGKSIEQGFVAGR